MQSSARSSQDNDRRSTLISLDETISLPLPTMSHPPIRGGVPPSGRPPRGAAMAKVNLFKISLDRIGRTVYQYDGELLRLPPSLVGSHYHAVGQWALYMLPALCQLHSLTSTAWVLRYHSRDSGKTPDL